MSTVLEERPKARGTLEGLVSRERINREPAAAEEKKKYEIIFPVDDTKVSDQAFDFVIQTARKFSSGIILVYVCKHSEVPAGFIEYARCERIIDYEACYYNWLASVRLGALHKKALEADVACRSRIFMGRMKDVLKSYSKDNDALVILNGSSKSKFGISVPILLIRESIFH